MSSEMATSCLRRLRVTCDSCQSSAMPIWAVCCLSTSVTSAYYLRWPHLTCDGCVLSEMAAYRLRCPLVVYDGCMLPGIAAGRLQQPHSPSVV